MGILALIILGAIVGFLIHLMGVGGPNSSTLWYLLVGVIGSLTGGFISTLFGFPGLTGINLYSILIGVLGSVVLVFILSQIQRA